jgi:hypothetical protein
MRKSKLFLIVMVFVIGSSLLVAYTSRGNDTSSAADVVTNVDSPGRIPDTNEHRRWSGEVFLSDNDSPDFIQPARESSKQAAEPTCISLDDLHSARRHGGCVE